MQLPNPLKYIYYIMRHGQSVPNVQKIIVSKLENGILPENGLTELGREQSQKSARLLLTTLKKTEEFVIIYSPFSRAKETAEEAKKILNCVEFKEDINLRERNFGDLELMSSDNYSKFWVEDRINADSKIFDSESPNEVAVRMVSVIKECESRNYPPSQKILFVTHGDPAQILQTVFKNIPISKHNTDVHYMDNAEIKRLN